MSCHVMLCAILWFNASYLYAVNYNDFILILLQFLPCDNLRDKSHHGKVVEIK